MTLGKVSTRDNLKISSTTFKSVLSHLNLLKRNNIELNEKSLTLNTIDMLNKLRDKHNNLLSDGYKRQIGMTIKRLYPNASINLQTFNKNRKQKRTRVSDPQFINNCKTIITRASEIIKEAYNQMYINDLGLYDTALSILLTNSTSLRITEIHQLKLMHIESIQKNEPIGINSKSSKNTRVVVPNDLLLSVFHAILKQRDRVEGNIIMRKNDNTTKYQLERFNNDYIIISSIDYMRKKLHELAASLLLKVNILGFNTFRKYITTVLIDAGAPLIAQALNNHSSVNTTFDHYNVVSTKLIQDTYNDLSKKLDKITNVENDEHDPSTTLNKSLIFVKETKIKDEPMDT